MTTAASAPWFWIACQCCHGTGRHPSCGLTFAQRCSEHDPCPCCGGNGSHYVQAGDGTTGRPSCLTNVKIEGR
jgi:hypothetical protein